MSIRGQTRSRFKKPPSTSKSEAELDAAIRKANRGEKVLFYKWKQTKPSCKHVKLPWNHPASSLVPHKRSIEGLKTMVDVLLAQRNAFSTKQDYVNAKV